MLSKTEKNHFKYDTYIGSFFLMVLILIGISLRGNLSVMK